MQKLKILNLIKMMKWFQKEYSSGKSLFTRSLLLLTIDSMRFKLLDILSEQHSCVGFFIVLLIMIKLGVLIYQIFNKNLKNKPRRKKKYRNMDIKKIGIKDRIALTSEQCMYKPKRF